MDGNLARYRGQATLKGGFLDRVLDGTGFIFVMAGFSWLVYQNGGEPYYLLIGPMTSAFYLVICYVYWTIAYMEQKYIGRGQMIKPGNNVRSIVHIPTWKYMLRGQKKLFSFHQADFYFWIGLGLILEIPEVIIWLLFVVLSIRVFERIKSRSRYLGSLDKDIYK
jgi:phosphatidylglycerophosphate synthase